MAGADTYTLPFFESFEECERAFSEWVQAGGRMRPGMYCVIQGQFYRYDGKNWLEVR